MEQLHGWAMWKDSLLRWAPAWGPILAAVLIIIGWWHNSRRDLNIKRRDTRVEYLIRAYRRIEAAANRHLDDPKDEDQMRCKREFEDALGDIQLFGSAEQLEFTRAIAESLVRTNRAEGALIDALLRSLRSDLRDELQLPQTEEALVHLRIDLRAASTRAQPAQKR
jgi:hypothetical protein